MTMTLMTMVMISRLARSSILLTTDFFSIAIMMKMVLVVVMLMMMVVRISRLAKSSSLLTSDFFLMAITGLSSKSLRNQSTSSPGPTCK